MRGVCVCASVLHEGVPENSTSGCDERTKRNKVEMYWWRNDISVKD